MQKQQIINRINRKLAGEMLSYSELVDHLDSVIDDINTMLNSKYPAFSEIPQANEYNVFPDKWIRQVVIPGAAWYFYVADEEGSQTAGQYKADYDKGLFFMLRDMVHLVPDEYRVQEVQGAVLFNEEDRGLNVDGNFF